MLEEVEGKLAQMLPYGFIDILYRFGWQINLSFSPQKADMNREFPGIEDVTEKNNIQSVDYIDTKITVDSVTHNDKYVTGYAKPYSTIVLMNGDVLIGSGRVDKYGKFRIHTYHHLKEHSIITAQVIFDGSYQESVMIHVN
ncbi:Ig-like domain-containing protein [Bacillus cereus]|uniref:Ig-like domain-containing protein n=2 Tax=Bacillus TaxID=1386 RepID=UPI003012E530